MPGEKTSGFLLHRKAKYLLELGAFLFVLLVSNHANGAFYINSDSKVVIISGYAPDLTKQELTPIHNRLDFILQGLPVDLKNVYGARVEYLSERTLIRRLDLQHLPRGDAKGIRTLFEKEKYTHLIVADVEMRDANAGSALIQVARLSEDGSVTEWDETQERYLRVAQTDPELNNLRQTILLDLLKFRAPDAPKRVNVSCILPRSQVNIARTNQTELEMVLSPYITQQLIDIHNTQKMMERGYRPLVHGRYYVFEFVDKEKTMIKCRPAAAPDNYVTDVSINLPDYSIEGDVGVARATLGRDSVELTIRVVRSLPKYCDETIPIRHEFDPSNYQGNGKQEFSVQFSTQILPAEYERAWSDNFEKSASCR